METIPKKTSSLHSAENFRGNEADKKLPENTLFTDSRTENRKLKTLQTMMSNSPAEAQLKKFQSAAIQSQGNIPIQLYKKKEVGYGSQYSMDSISYRNDHKQWSPAVNVASITTADGYKSARESSGADFHSEKLLIGEALIQKNDQPLAHANYHRYYGKTEIYTEREPCSSCNNLLKVALNDDDTVYYTVPIGERQAMEMQLKSEMDFYDESKVADEIEAEETERNRETLINIVISRKEQAELMGHEVFQDYGSRFNPLYQRINQLDQTAIYYEFEETKLGFIALADSILDEIRVSYNTLQSELDRSGSTASEDSDESYMEDSD